MWSDREAVRLGERAQLGGAPAEGETGFVVRPWVGHSAASCLHGSHINLILSHS